MKKYLLAFTIAALVAAPASAVVTFDWVPVGDAGNPPAIPATNCLAASCGSVPYPYYISKYEVTNAQYAEFLNAKAASDPLELYNAGIGQTYGGITRSGASGSYNYMVKPGFENKPVVYVSFYDALRFANWLNNGQGAGSTETGAYTLLGGTPIPLNGNAVTRNSGANTFLTSENEWYKAAYFNGTTYFLYPVGTNTETVCAAPGPTANTANCNLAVGAVTNVGAYTGSASPYGTFDQGGNVWEWNEQQDGGSGRGLRGGGWDQANYLAASGPLTAAAWEENGVRGFRVARFETECGNGIVEVAFGEECDDSNIVNGDGCSDNCIIEECSNGTDDDGDGTVDLEDLGCTGAARVNDFETPTFGIYCLTSSLRPPI